MTYSFHPLESEHACDFAFAKMLYETAFPPEERRDVAAWFELQKNNPEFRVEVMRRNAGDETDTPVALLCYWQFPHFCYVEHLAVDERCRRQHLGTEVLLRVSRLGSPIVLEVEPEVDEATRNRLLFYRSAGYDEPYKDYLQPPYSSEKPAVPLWLLSNRPSWLWSHVEKVKDTLYKKVYQCKQTIESLHSGL